MSEPVRVGDIDTPFEWVIQGVERPRQFFEHLPALLPPDSILYLEGLQIAPAVAAFYRAHGAPNPAKIRCETIYPKPQSYHIAFSADICSTLRQFAEIRPLNEMFDHIKAYRGDTLLLYFHDAFQNRLALSDHLPGDAVAKFCELLGVVGEREKTQRLDLEQLKKVQAAFDDLYRSVNPWYKRFWWWLGGR